MACLKTATVFFSVLLGLPFLTWAASLCLDYDLQAFVQESLEQDPGFAKDLQTYLKTKYQRISAQAIAAWTLAGSVEADHIENFSNNAFQPEQIDATGYEISLQKLFYETGTRLSLGHSQDNFRYRYSPLASSLGSGWIDVSDTSHEQDVSISLIQPLLKNTFGLSDRFPIQAAELQMQAALLDAQEAWENRLAGLYNIYLDWAAAYESTQAVRQQAAELEKVANLVEQKYRAQVAEKTDWLRVQENQLQVQNQLAQAENRLDTTAAAVVYFRTGKMAATEELHALAPMMASTLQECEAEFVQPAPEHGSLRLTRRLLLLQQQLEIQRQVVENSQLPQVDLVGTARAKARGTAAGELYPPLEQKDYSVRLQAQYPLGDTKAQGDLAQVSSGLEELAKSLDMTRRDLTLAFWQMRQTLHTLQTVVHNHQAWVKLAEEKLELNMRNYRIGRLDTYLLLDSSNALIAARLQEVQSAIEFKRLLVSYLALTDRLLERHPALVEKLHQAQEKN